MLEQLAQRLEARASWCDLELPQREMTLLRQIADEVRRCGALSERFGSPAPGNSGLGVSALFAGASGTGKTMAAEVIANALRLDLYRIDLAGVASKHIGETGKNLRRLFDAAEGSGAILIFDEADALLGTRTDVRDSHDRYANIETSYLLQRMEGYRGLAILTTNMRDALDPAFIRRFRLVVEFPLPGPAERRRMWQRVLPENTSSGELDYDRLAQLEITGGAIRTIALDAALRAAGSSRAVTMPVLLEAARETGRKSGRPIDEA